MELSDKAVTLNYSKLRIIPFEYFSGIENMSLDYFYSLLVEKTKIPILRFYGWQPYSLSFGHNQDISNLNTKSIEKTDIETMKELIRFQCYMELLRDWNERFKTYNKFKLD